MPSKRNSTTSITPRAKVWVEIDDEYVFGLGSCLILEAVQESVSIKQAAEQVGKSYRHVWSRIKEVEDAIGFPLVDSQVGGGDVRRSQLTARARQLVASYRELREQVFGIVDRRFAGRFEKILLEVGER